MYRAIYQANQLIYGTGRAVVVSGWTPKEVVAGGLDSSSYAAIGQLYSPTRGINYLVRNLLANPWVNPLVVLVRSPMDKASQCLLDFMANGVREGVNGLGKQVWVINSDIAGYIDWEVSYTAIEDLRKGLEYRRCRLLSELPSLLDSDRSSWGQPREFPMELPVASTLPGPYYGHRVEGSITECWLQINQRIMSSGRLRQGEYDWLELIDMVAVVVGDELADWLPIDQTMLPGYIKQVVEDSPLDARYTYGSRLRSWFGVDQIEDLIAKLEANLETTRGVMNLWHSRGEEIEPPCLNHIWVRVVDRELVMTATFRSNDMYSAWITNVVGLRGLQQVIANRLGLEVGVLITNSLSAHIYSDCWEAARLLIEKHYPLREKYSDAVGNFIIEPGLAIHTSPSGEELGRLVGSPLEIVREIAARCPTINASHLGYIGIELERASRLGEEYRQDGSR